MDRFAFQAANLLAGNASNMTTVELGAGDLLLSAMSDCVIAVTGAGYELSVNLWNFPLWGSYFVRGGWSIRLTRSGFGMWAYVAIAGGIDVPHMLGSGSTYLRGHFGGLEGRRLRPGDTLRSLRPAHSPIEAAARTLRDDARPAYQAAPYVEVIPGPQSDYFSERDLSAFFSSTYRVSPSSDRMGYRLEGPRLEGRGKPELSSEGMTTGSIQVPSDGQPIAMMADSATTGGYPKIACITSTHAPLLAQCTPGKDDVHFRQVSLEAAQDNYRTMMEKLKRGIVKA
jgi:antagonist of KipI